MKAKVKQIVDAYNALGEAKTSTLESSDVLSIIKARRAMRPIVEDYEAFVKDATEKLKPADFDALVEIERKGDKATNDEKAYHNENVTKYHKAIVDAINEEFSKEVELELPKLSDEVQVKLLKENSWSAARLDNLSILV